MISRLVLLHLKDGKLTGAFCCIDIHPSGDDLHSHRDRSLANSHVSAVYFARDSIPQFEQNLRPGFH